MTRFYAAGIRKNHLDDYFRGFIDALANIKGMSRDQQAAAASKAFPLA